MRRGIVRWSSGITRPRKKLKSIDSIYCVDYTVDIYTPQT